MSVNTQNKKIEGIWGDVLTLSSGRQNAINENTYVAVLVLSGDIYHNLFAGGVNWAQIKDRKLNTGFIKSESFIELMNDETHFRLLIVFIFIFCD